MQRNPTGRQCSAARAERPVARAVSVRPGAIGDVQRRRNRNCAHRCAQEDRRGSLRTRWVVRLTHHTPGPMFGHCWTHEQMLALLPLVFFKNHVSVLTLCVAAFGNFMQYLPDVVSDRP